MLYMLYILATKTRISFDAIAIYIISDVGRRLMHSEPVEIARAHAIKTSKKSFDQRIRGPRGC